MQALGGYLYSAAVISMTPLAAGLFAYKRWRGMESSDCVPPPAAPVVWFAVSTIGEAAIALPLVQRVLQVHPGLHVLVTAASTPALALFDRSVRTDQVHLQMSPLDTPGAVKRFVSYWKPIAAAFVMLSEPRLAPLLLQQCKKQGVPTALLNVHVPGKEFDAWDQSPLGRAWLSGVLSLPDLIVAQSDSDTAKLLMLGAPIERMPLLSAELSYAAALTVNLVGWKLQRPPMSAVDALLSSLGGRPCWLATNTHQGEEAFAATLHVHIISHAERPIANLLTLIAPFDSRRSPKLVSQLSALGLRVGLWSRAHAGPHAALNDLDIVIIDEPHSLALLYASVSIVFVGGTLFPTRRHHSLADVAVCGCTIVTGPNLAQYEGMKDELNLAALEEAAELQEELHCNEMVYVDAQGVEWPSAPQGMHEDTAHAEADASPFGTPSSTDTSPLGGLQPPTQERLAPPRDHDLEPAPRGGSGSGSGSGRRASQRHMGAGLATVEEHRAAAGNRASARGSALGPTLGALPHRRSSASSVGSFHGSSMHRSAPSDSSFSCDGLTARRNSESRSSAHAHGLRSMVGGPVVEGGFATQEPIWAPPSRHCGQSLLLAHMLGGQPAVLSCSNAHDLRDAIHRLLSNPLETKSRGYAAATAASRLTRAMVATVLGLFGARTLQSQLQQDGRLEK